MREVDPEAVRLLAHLLGVESSPWPVARTAYAEALLALAIRCEAAPAQAEIFRWAHAEFAALTQHRDPQTVEARHDAMTDLVTGFSGLLLRWRAGLDDAIRPNIRSMIRAYIIWRANQHLESRHRRHARREMAPSPTHARPARRARAHVLAEADALCRQLAEADHPAARALLLVGLGHSIAEAARRTGASRQQIYRYRDALRRLLNPGDVE